MRFEVFPPDFARKFFAVALSPASVDKSVNKVALPSKYYPFLHLQDVFA